ncbi:MAG: sensor histidine kinase [Lachnospirales bacterium]
MKIFEKIRNSLVIKMWLIEVLALSLMLCAVFFVQKSMIKFDFYNAQLVSYQKVMQAEFTRIYMDNFQDLDKLFSEFDRLGTSKESDILVLDKDFSIYYNSFSNELATELSVKEEFYLNEQIINVEVLAVMKPFYENFEKPLSEGNSASVIYNFNAADISFLCAFPFIVDDTTYYIISHTDSYIDKSTLDFYDEYIINIYIFILAALTFISYFTSVYFVRPIKKVEYVLKNFRTKDALKKLPLNRTDEIGGLSRSVYMLNTQLENADGLHKEVFSNISHELKTPIVLIAGYSELVRDISWKDDKKREEHLNLVIKEANRMTNMVNEILDYSQVANGYVTLNLDYIELNKILQSELAAAQATAVHYNLKVDYIVEFDIETKILADSLRLTQVMRNLLNNAINHSDPDSTIYIRCKSIDNGIKVSVENKGEKIPDIDKGLIFNRYFRAQHQNSRREGSGIGLSIVRSIYEAHSFEYGIEYIKGYNSFYFIILNDKIDERKHK